MSEEPKPQKKKESTRSIVIMAVICGAFLWWWFTLDTTPEDVGPAGLVERAFAELEHQKKPAPILMEFDLLELSMAWLRTGDLKAASQTAEKIHEPVLQAKAWQSIAQAYLGKEAGSMGPALTMLGKIPDVELRASAQEVVLMEIARSGFPDVAWEQVSTPLMKAKLIRVMAETDAQNLAQEKLKSTEGELLASAQPAVLEELAWTLVWLRQPERVLEMMPKLSASAQDEIYAELFRVTRMESPEKADEMLSKMPEHLRLAARIEASKFSDKPEVQDQLIAEMAASAKSDSAAAQIKLAHAQWQLSKPAADTWKSTATKAEALISALEPASARIPLLLELAQQQNDGLELDKARSLLEAAKKVTRLAGTPTERLAMMAPILEMTLSGSVEDDVKSLLNELSHDLAANGAVEASSLATLSSISAALLREGDWTQVSTILEKTSGKLRHDLLNHLGVVIIEASAGPSFAGCQDNSLQKVRAVAASQGETEAAKLATRMPATPERARAWIEIAKGLIWKGTQEAETTPPRPSE